MKLERLNIDIQEMGAYEMVKHNGGGEIADGIKDVITASIALSIVILGSYHTFKLGYRAVSCGINTIGSAIKAGCNYCQQKIYSPA